MMPNMGPSGTEFYVLSVMSNFVTALIVAWAYILLGKCVPGKAWKSRGTHYGLLVFFMASIPGMLSMDLLMSVPLVLNLAWTMEALVIYLAGGMIIAGFNKA